MLIHDVLSLFLFTQMLFAVNTRPRTPVIELRTIKTWAVSVTLSCGSELETLPVAVERKRTVDYRGFRLKFSTQYGGTRLLFAMLKTPGRPIGNEEFVVYNKTSFLENFKNLVRVFMEIDSTFAGFHVQPGRGFAYDSRVPADYGHDVWNGFELNWLEDQLRSPNGEGRELSAAATESLRALFRAGGGPITFEDLFDRLYPGRKDASPRHIIMNMRADLKREIDGPGLRVHFDKDSEQIRLLFPRAAVEAALINDAKRVDQSHAR